MDTIEKEFDYKGHHCIVTFTEIGYRCGFISLNKDDVFYDVGFNKINDSYKLSFKLDSSGRTFPRNDGNYWIGFTCNSKADKADLKHVTEVYGEKPLVLTLLNMNNIPTVSRTGTIRSVEYIEERIKHLVDEVENENRRTNSRT